VGDGGVPLDEILVHDETNRTLAQLLVGLEPPQFPVALGVLYCSPPLLRGGRLRAGAGRRARTRAPDLGTLLARDGRGRSSRSRRLPVSPWPPPPRGDGRWSAAAPLPEPIQELSAAVLHGKIYVAGGIDRTGRPTAAAFRYDPAANRWEAHRRSPGRTPPHAARRRERHAVRRGWARRAELRAREQSVAVSRGPKPLGARAPLPTPRGASGAGAVNGKLVVVGGWGAGRHWSEPRRSTTPRPTAGAMRHRSRRRAIISPRPSPALWYTRSAGDRSIPTGTTMSWKLTIRRPIAGPGGAPCRAGAAGSRRRYWTTRSTWSGERRGARYSRTMRCTTRDRSLDDRPALPAARHGLGAAVVGGKLYVIGGGPRRGFTDRCGRRVRA